MIKLPKLLQLALLKKEDSQEKRFLVLDTGSRVVKSACFSIDASNKIKVEGFGKEIRVGDGLKALEEATIGAVNKARSALGERIADLVYAIPSEKAILCTTTAKITRAKPQSPIKESEIAEITAKITKSAYIESAKRYGELYKNAEAKIDLLNTSFVATTIDGSKVLNPLKYQGEKIEASLFCAFAPEEEIKKAKRLAQILGCHLSAVTSSLYTITKSLTLKNLDFNGTIVDIGAKVTNVAVVFGGGIYANLAVNLGTEDGREKICEVLGISPAESGKILEMYKDQKLDPESYNKVKGALHNSIDVWITGLESLFLQFEGVKIFPENIYLLGGGSNIAEYQNLLTTQDWSKNIAFKSAPVITKLELSDLWYLTPNATEEPSLKGETGTLSLGLAGLELWKEGALYGNTN
ncbi:hypothetical protein L6255_01240 [Candidatus Parcubacteria bacterium]|nr:hypothetical protein [Patescibacteria group bacterium]MBU4381054.1 hypothetical protein [Patescibacteria group bacterium]MCG2689043.1 hypothetical protein [Candidatus Parcubacteria bacterium]